MIKSIIVPHYVLNVFDKYTVMRSYYDICDRERVPIIMNWVGCEGPHFEQTLTDDK